MLRALISATILFALLAGDALAAKPLVLWHSYRGKERAALEETVRLWNDGVRGNHPRIETLAIPYDAFADKVTAAIPRGHGPDLFIFAHDRIGDWAESHIVEPIEFWMTEAHADRFFFKTIDALCYGDSLYGLPMAFKTTALFYNKALLPRPPRTTGELLAVGRRLTRPDAGQYGLAYDNAKLYFHAAWLFGFGGGIFDARGQLQIASQAAVDAAAFARRLGGPGGIVPPEPSATLTTALFNGGRAAMAISGPWMLGEISPKVDVGVAPLPKVDATGSPARPFLGVEGLMMSGRATRKHAAFAAMRFLTGDAAAVVRARDARQPVANVAAWKDPKVRADPLLGAFREQLAATALMPGTPEMRVVWSPYDIALQKIIARGESPRAALAAAAAEIRRYLRPRGGARTP